jgi:hypothetical protein
MSIAGRYFLDGVIFDITIRLRFYCADNTTYLKICILSIGSISITGRERGVSKEYIITFTNFYSESSSYLVTI